MAENKKLYDFADKWLKIFASPDTQERDVEAPFERDCIELKIKMDCGDAFRTLYGDMSFYHFDGLQNALEHGRDEQLWASGIFSKWRYITHWTDQSLLSNENKKWFVSALERLRSISGVHYVSRWRTQAELAPPAIRKFMQGTMELFLSKNPEEDPDLDQGK